jgi:predicted DNA-binding mobile mystery protein A
MSTHWLAIRQLDRQLKEWQAVSNKYGKPRAGWVKTLREALSMSAEQLANRLGLTRARIVQLEKAEINDAVTLRTLKEAANAMECEFIYAIVPKGTSTLEDIIKTRAEIIANERIARVAHTMALEDQALEDSILLNQKSELARSLAKHLNKKLWLEQDHFDAKQKTELKNSIAESIYHYIQKINEEQDDDQNNRQLYNSSEFSKILNNYLSIEKNKKIGSALSNNLNNPKYIKELVEAIKRIMKKDEKKKNQQTDIFKKLVENLQKKK